MQRVPGRQTMPAGTADWRNWAWAVMLVLTLAACAEDPATVGITGPYPEGVAPVTLRRALPRSEASDDTPGVRVDATDHLSPTARSRGSATPTRRYYGYDH